MASDQGKGKDDLTGAGAAQTVADSQKTQDSRSANPGPAKRGGTGLQPAGESGDPAVHQLLAELQSATLNGDEDAVAQVHKDLERLGFEAR